MIEIALNESQQGIVHYSEVFPLHSLDALQHFSATCTFGLRPNSAYFSPLRSYGTKNIDIIKECIETIQNESQQGSVHYIGVFPHVYISTSFSCSHVVTRWLTGIKITWVDAGGMR